MQWSFSWITHVLISQTLHGALILLPEFDNFIPTLSPMNSTHELLSDSDGSWNYEMAHDLHIGGHENPCGLHPSYHGWGIRDEHHFHIHEWYGQQQQDPLGWVDRQHHRMATIPCWTQPKWMLFHVSSNVACTKGKYGWCNSTGRGWYAGNRGGKRRTDCDVLLS